MLLSKHYPGAARPPRELAEAVVLMLAPLAPHITGELWTRLGHDASLVRVPFPVGDEALAAEATVTMPVQVNGKVRFTVSIPADAGEDEIKTALLAHEDYAKHTAGRTVKRLIVVPGRIVNIALG